MERERPSAQDDARLESLLESILLVAGGPTTIAAMAAAVGSPRGAVRAALARLQQRQVGGIRVQVHAETAQIVTAPENNEIVRRFLGTEKPPALSRTTLETLTIIAYRQPVTRAEIEAARGTNSDRQVQTLLARGLIDERGHRDVLGRPMQYGTTLGFLEYFGLRSLDELPPLPEAQVTDLQGQEIGLRSVEVADNDEGD